MAACVPETRYRYPGADIGEVAAAQYGDGALCRQAFQRLGRSVDEGGGARIVDDGGQGSVVVEKQHRFSGAQDTDYLAVRQHRIGELRHLPVTRANSDVFQV